MPLNWVVEALKWKWMYSSIQPISLANSLVTVLVGNTFGMVTPARLGEYGGRIITSDIDHKMATVLGTFIGSLTQNIWNILIGALFSYLFIKSFLDLTYIDGKVLIVGIIIQLIIMLSILYYLPKIIRNLVDSRYFHKFFKVSWHNEDFGMLESSMINKILSLSLVRFCVYAIQYVLVLLAFGAGISLFTLFAGVSIIYMIQTILPVPSLISVIARGEIAIIVWTKLGLTMPQALLSSYTIWVINLIIPALAGAILMYTLDFKKFWKTRV